MAWKKTCYSLCSSVGNQPETLQFPWLLVMAGDLGEEDQHVGEGLEMPCNSGWFR